MNDRLQITIKRYICELCGLRFAETGECPTCDGVRLRDLADPAVRSWITSQDASRRSLWLKNILIISVVAALGLTFVLRELAVEVPVPHELVAGASALALSLLLNRLFRPKKLAPQLDDAEERWLYALHHEKASTAAVHSAGARSA